MNLCYIIRRRLYVSITLAAARGAVILVHINTSLMYRKCDSIQLELRPLVGAAHSPEKSEGAKWGANESAGGYTHVYITQGCHTPGKSWGKHICTKSGKRQGTLKFVWENLSFEKI